MTEEDPVIDLTVEIVVAQVSNNTIPDADVPGLIQKVHDALRSVSRHREQTAPAKNGMVSVRASIKPDYVVCMECGSRQTILRRHIQAAHGMTPDQYRQEYGLRRDYPMVPPNYALKRSELAKASGLGRKGRNRAA